MVNALILWTTRYMDAAVNHLRSQGFDVKPEDEAPSEEQILELKARLRSGNTPQKMALRCRVVLLAHQGVANQSIAEQLNLFTPDCRIVALRVRQDRDGGYYGNS